MSDPIKVKLTWHTAFDSETELQDFLDEVAGIHARRYGTDVAYNALAEDGFYNGERNFIRTDITRPKPKVPGLFKAGDPVLVKGVAKTDPNHEGEVSFVRDGKVFVHNMNMPYAGSLNRFFDPDELEHLQ